MLQKILKYCNKLEILQKKFKQVRITRTKKGLDEALAQQNLAQEEKTTAEEASGLEDRLKK